MALLCFMCLFPPPSFPRCPVTDKGQMTKVQVPAVVVQMQIRGTHQHLNPRNKKKENLLLLSRRKIPNSPAKLLLSCPLVLKGNNAKNPLIFIFFCWGGNLLIDETLIKQQASACFSLWDCSSKHVVNFWISCICSGGILS